MGCRYLLDTNIISDLARRPQGPIAGKIAELGPESVCTSLIVSCELRFGVKKNGSHKLHSQIDAVVGAIEVLPLDSPVEHEYAEIRTQLEGGGQPIGPNDLLIAAHARALGLTLVTANSTEFRRVPGLAVENWLE
jgi:tRNA(fMet)-specific endonuclease VapC